MLLQCKNVQLSYDGVDVLRGLSFDLKGGEYLCILGENGSGKSTLVKAILGLKQVSEGAIIYGDGLKAAEIGYMPQQNGAMRDFPASVYEIVLSGCRGRSIGPFASAEQKKTADDSLHRLGIYDLKKRSYRELSGGQQQRVLLARALCATERLLLLDEPVAALDPLMTHELYQVIKQLNESGITVIMVSHDVTCSAEQATHILHLHGGGYFFGTSHEYMHSEIGKYYMGEECHKCLKH